MSINLFCIGWLAVCPLEIPFLYHQRTGFHSKIKTKFHSKIILCVHSRHKGHACSSQLNINDLSIMFSINAIG